MGDVALIRGSEALKRGIKTFKDSNAAQTLGNFAKSAIEYTPILGFVSRFQDGNAKAARKLVDNTLDPAQQQALREFGESFGGGIDFQKASTSKAYENIRAKFGEEHFITKGAKVLNDAFMLTSQSQTQRHILRSIRADESGNLLAFLSEAANSSPTLQKNLKSILNQTTFNLKKQLEYLELKPSEIKEIFTNFEKGTKEEYAQAMEGVLAKVYDEKYKVVLSKEGVDNLNNTNPLNYFRELETLEATNTPQKLTDKEIEEVISRFSNVENLKEHLATRADAQQRAELFNLLDSTIQEPQLHWGKDGKDKRLKKFKNASNSKEPYFYLLVTRDGDKTFVTHLKTRDLRYIGKEIGNADEIFKGADIIGNFRQQAGSDISHKLPTPKDEPNYTTNPQAMPLFAKSLMRAGYCPRIRCAF